jgi:hypothetical protein
VLCICIDEVQVLFCAPSSSELWERIQGFRRKILRVRGYDWGLFCCVVGDKEVEEEDKND